MTRTRWLATVLLGFAASLANASQPGAASGTAGSEPTGALAIRVIQGTEGGLSPAGATAHVHLFARQQLFRTIDTQLDDGGFAVVPDLPISMGVTPVVQIEHAGVTYQETGPPMDAANPTASVEVTVYDVTEAEPAWSVETRQLSATLAQDAVRVSEVLRVQNPADATWLGGETASTGKQTTVRVGLPAGARDVHLDHGFHGWCCTTYEDGVLAVQMPLMPGRTSYAYSYFVPVEGDRAAVEFSTPAPTGRVTVFVPDDGSPVEAEGLADLGSQGDASGTVRMFQGQGLATDQRVGVVLAGLSRPVAQAITPAETGSIGALAWVAIGAGAVVIVGAAFVLLRGPRAAE